ncbi:MAG: hypothetical protein WC632_00965 [Candidatus Margulisiibacteriota bacterium]
MARQIMIGVILAVSLAYAAFTYWPLLASYLPGTVPSPKPALVAPAPAAVPTQEIQAAEKNDIDLLYLPTLEVKAIDPFALRIEIKRREELPPPPEAETPGAPAAPAAKPVEPKLEGIWVDSGMQVAFISGQALTMGSKILGWRVSSISKEQVVLTRGTQTKILRVEGK